MHYVSRKTLRTISENLNYVKLKTFDESHVKELMVDLRELARESPKLKINHPQAHIISDFAEVCDFIAHPSRTQGAFRRKIREKLGHIGKFIQEGKQLAEWGSIGRRYQHFHADQYSFGLLSTAALHPLPGDYAFTSANTTKQLIREINVCIASILQDARVDLGDEGQAFLRLREHHGFWWLYCRVHFSKITSAPIEFPVMQTDMPTFCSPVTQEERRPYIEVVDEQLAFPLYETERTVEGRLILTPFA
ncbi:hypothetical protein [Roseateles noduli]|uniref:hypothetical protein n=1 Tax=Roseateles noduli TaxID=2052484 RepID=UPI003D65DDC4